MIFFQCKRYDCELVLNIFSIINMHKENVDNFYGFTIWITFLLLSLLIWTFLVDFLCSIRLTFLLKFKSMILILSLMCCFLNLKTNKIQHSKGFSQLFLLMLSPITFLSRKLLILILVFFVLYTFALVLLIFLINFIT